MREERTLICVKLKATKMEIICKAKRTVQLANNLKTMKSISFRNIVLGACIISLVIVAIFPNADSLAEAKKLKLKEKKLLKKLVKGLILKNLSTKKNFLPLPVPIPVPVELSEPPVYLKGKPRYVTIYKPAPAPKVPTTVYHMPVYSPTYEYMMTDPMGMYGPMMMNGMNSATYNGYGGSAKHSTKEANTQDSQTSSINFNDFDDDMGNYYLRQAYSNPERKLVDYGKIKRVDLMTAKLAIPADEMETFDNDDKIGKQRVKRQVYHQSSYENEPPCYGFPLEVNIKSRIKMDQIFPIKGNSQFKKCIKVGRPLLPPVEDDRPY